MISQLFCFVILQGCIIFAAKVTMLEIVWDVHIALEVSTELLCDWK